MSYFEHSFTDLLLKEGGYSDHPYDPGGETMYGITKIVARSNGYYGNMKDMSLEWAKRIYKGQYWDAQHLDTIASISPSVAFEMFDTGVNMGVGVAGKFLQESLNGLNRQASMFPDLKVDGLVGNVTIECLNQFVKSRGKKGETVLVRMLNCLQGADYIRQSKVNPKKEEFIYGWFANRVTV
jgi:lysozyme family protein